MFGLRLEAPAQEVVYIAMLIGVCLEKLQQEVEFIQLICVFVYRYEHWT